MSTSPAKLAANQANARHSTGPRTDSGKAASANNAVKHGLFSAKDYIRPGEQPEYDELDRSLRADLYPEGRLEHHLVDEIRRAMWRLRRCGEVEAGMVETCNAAGIADPMQNEPTAATQLTVDRARAQCHRLLHKCVAELRKLQTERHFRFQFFMGKAYDENLGICDWRSLMKGMHERAVTELRQTDVLNVRAAARYAENDRQAMAEAFSFLSSEKDLIAKRTHTPIARNAQCPCGSGLKHKRCCGPDAALRATRALNSVI